MNIRTWTTLLPLTFGALFLAALLVGPLVEASQQPKPEPEKKEPPLGPKGSGGFMGGPFGGQPRQLVKQFDKNGDGWLNNEERQAARAFLKKDGGGRPGFGPGGPKGPGGPGRPGGPPLSKPLLESLDTDKDGAVTKDEWLAGVKKFFAASDKDKLGQVEEKAIADEIGRLMPRPPGFPAGPPGGFGRGNPLAAGMVKRADTDKDGKVTLKEFLAAAEALFQETDKGKKGKLDETELTAGLALVMPEPTFGPPGGFGPGGFGKGGREPAKPGPKVTPADVKAQPKAALYDPTVLRTLFLEFENADWEAELAEFRNTDVEVPATLTVDGKKYANVGIHFRGMSSYMMVPAGYKRSLGLSLNLANPKQRLHGYKTLNLLNANGDSSLLSSVLYSHIARQHIPAPRANLVKVVINGESWGVYSNVQQFNKDFVAENFQTSKGARWKVKGSPGAASGLEFISDNIEDYKRRYTIKSDDDEKDWKALVALCRTLNKTPLDKLEEALKPMLDIDGALWFLALDVALINSDGYWTRASDYNIYRDPKGKFHILPHDMNEAFQPAMSFGFGGPGKGGPGKGGPGKDDPGKGPGGSGINLDPLVALTNPRMPLRSRLLAVPSLKARYLEHVRTLAREALDWKKLGPVVAQYRALIEKEVELDTRKLSSLVAFQRTTADTPVNEGGFPGRGPGMSLRTFADQRRTYLLGYEEKKAQP